jgi:hyperosmotically inducible protein
MKKTIAYSMIVMSIASVPLATLSSGCAARHYSSAGAYADDKTITARVKTALTRDPIAKAIDINVTTYNREVQLSGFVGSEQEKVRAAQVAASVSGVAAVHNDLLVRTGR